MTEPLQIEDKFFLGKLTNRKWRLVDGLIFNSFSEAGVTLRAMRDRGEVEDGTMIMSLHGIMENCVPDDNHGITI